MSPAWPLRWKAFAMTIRTVQFLALVASALALVPSGAHLAAMPNKIGLPQTEYFIVQGIYEGWALLGALWPVALFLNGALAVLVRSQRWPFRLALLAALCFALMLTIFFLWTFPANAATRNWTSVPANWEALRRQWEYSHAMNSLLALLALCSVAGSVLWWKPPTSDGR